MKINQDILEEYIGIDLEGIKQKGIKNHGVSGYKHFSESLEKLDDVKGMMDEMVSIYEKVKIPQGLVEKLEEFIASFNDEVRKITDYNHEEDAPSNFSKRNQIFQQIEQYKNNIFTPKFLSIYNAIKSFDLENIRELKREAEETLSFSKGKKKEYEKLSSIERKEEVKKVFSKYARFFADQAKEHSCMVFSTKKPFLRLKFWKSLEIKFGSAQIWFMIGIIFIAVFIYIFLEFIIGEDAINRYREILDTIVVDKDKSGNQFGGYFLLISLVIKNLVLISFFAYLVSLSFRQFSINKHLYVLNKHRENALNTLQGVIDAIAEESPEVRNSLVLETMKAIYEQGQTGYLNEKGSPDINFSFNEISKILGKD